MRSTLIAALGMITAVHCVTLKQSRLYIIDHPGWQYVGPSLNQDVDAHATFLGGVNQLYECRELAEKRKLDVFGYESGDFSP
jgi:hypothetical protein